MSLHVLLAHTGASIKADPRSFASLEDLRSWIARDTAIGLPHQILMTARGKQVKLQSLLSEKEIFLYDRRILASSSSAKVSALLPNENTQGSFYLETPPESATNEDTLQESQNLCKRRRAWAIQLAEGSRNVSERVGKLEKEIGVIRRGAAIAVKNIKQHAENLRAKYHESKTWTDQVCEDQAFLLSNWQHALAILGSIQANAGLGRCMRDVRSISEQQDSVVKNTVQATLRDFVGVEEVKEAAISVEKISKRFSTRVEDLKTAYDGALGEANAIIDAFQGIMVLSNSDAGAQADRLMEEIEVLTRKISADYEHVLGLPDTSKSISQASKIVQLHKSNFVPSLIQANEEINQLLEQAIEAKGQVVQSSIRNLQQISLVESTVSSVHSKLAKLDIDEESGKGFDVLNLIIRLPSVYGSLLVECVRRQEWAEKMTADSSSLVEEIATYKEEESKRRRKWTKDMEGAINLESLDNMALGIEVNVQSQKQNWPCVSRDDITEFLRRLSDAGDLDGTLAQVEELVKTLDAPSKQQARRAKAFKNGSVHEAVYGKTSLLLRGDEEAFIGMRIEKSKVEDKLKSAESRVRKLEDLLHRQSQISPFPRPMGAADLAPVNAPTFERYATSPVPNFKSALSKARESGSRRSSVSSRQVSVSNEPEDKILAQRVAGLEADLMKEKAKSADLAKTATAKSDAENLLKDQVREAVSTKEDLLGNLEAQQREFDDERRLLHEEKSMLTLKIDELEDEFDRILGSREHEDRVRALEEELEQVRTEAVNEVESARRQANLLQDKYNMQLNQIRGLEQEVQQQKEDRLALDHKVDQVSQQLKDQGQARSEHHKSLRTTLLHLSSDEDASDNFDSLIGKVETIAERSAAHLKDLKDALASMHADKDALDTRVKGQDEEIYNLRERLGGEERGTLSLREEISALQKDYASMHAQLEYERHEHAQLKTKFASGETDSEALRLQLTDKGDMIGDLLSRIAEHEVQHQNHGKQLSEREASLESTQLKVQSLQAAHAAQASRSTGLAQRLLTQNIALERLVEQIGLTISRDEDKMVIQKAPRATGASTTLLDPSASMKRSVSGPLPTKGDPEPLVDPELLHWADAADLDELESRFGAFMKEADNFEIDVFNEGVYKRVKEIEHIARKWQKEARAYRDRSHRAQTDAHDRIALRNFKEGDLALFLPTRDQATKPWAAFNVGAPHCFLREQDSHNLGKRDWLIARISKVEERVVDLSKSITGGLRGSGDQRFGGDKSDSGAFPNDENPYELSDGLRWYLIDAAEEKPGAPINIGTGKVTVASTNVDAKGSMRMKKASDGNGATKTLTRSLDSRRSSTNSKKGLVAVTSNATAGPTELEGMLEQSIDNAAAAAAATSNLHGDKDGQEVHETDRPQSSQTQDTVAPRGLGPEHATSAMSSPSKPVKAVKSSPRKPLKSKAWDSLWSLDLNLESGKGKKV